MGSFRLLSNSEPKQIPEKKKNLLVMEYKNIKQNKYSSESENYFNHALSICAEEISSVSNTKVNNQIANNYKKQKQTKES